MSSRTAPWGAVLLPDLDLSDLDHRAVAKWAGAAHRSSIPPRSGRLTSGRFRLRTVA